MNIVQIYHNVIKFYRRHKIPLSTEHKRYLKHARRELAPLYPTKQDQERLEPYSDLILSFFLLDLEPLRPQLQAFYHPKPRGTPPRVPIQMFRSLLCMILSGRTLSFTKWVKLLRSEPLFAVLSGFEDGSPGNGRSPSQTIQTLTGGLAPALFSDWSQRLSTTWTSPWRLFPRWVSIFCSNPSFCARTTWVCYPLPAPSIWQATALNSKPAPALWGANSAIATSGASIVAIARVSTPTASPLGDGTLIGNAIFTATPSMN